MSEHNNEQGNDSPNLGFSTRTDVGGARQTQGDARPDERPVVEPQPVTSSDEAPSNAEENRSANKQSEAGKPLGDDAPKLSELQGQICPNCHTGVLYVLRYDPNALHEHGQNEALAAGHESGGAYDVACFSCQFRESRAFNPGNRFGR